MGGLWKITLLEKHHEKCVLRKEKRFTVLWRISIICRILTVISSTDLNHGNAQGLNVKRHIKDPAHVWHMGDAHVRLLMTLNINTEMG